MDDVRIIRLATGVDLIAFTNVLNYGNLEVENPLVLFIKKQEDRQLLFFANWISDILVDDTKMILNQHQVVSIMKPKFKIIYKYIEMLEVLTNNLQDSYSNILQSFSSNTIN
jgi:hypothetical protein